MAENVRPSASSGHTRCRYRPPPSPPPPPPPSVGHDVEVEVEEEGGGVNGGARGGNIFEKPSKVATAAVVAIFFFSVRGADCAGECRRPTDRPTD
jgi:hypothetical protein